MRRKMMPSNWLLTSGLEGARECSCLRIMLKAKLIERLAPLASPLQ